MVDATYFHQTHGWESLPDSEVSMPLLCIEVMVRFQYWHNFLFVCWVPINHIEHISRIEYS